jgi:hypothetical protein
MLRCRFFDQYVRRVFWSVGGFVYFAAMKKLLKTIDIQASAATIWSCIVEKEPYQTWTSVFGPGSTFEGAWRKDAELRFLGPSEDGTASGMLARVEAYDYPHFISLDILGEIRNGELRNDEASKNSVCPIL